MKVKIQHAHRDVPNSSDIETTISKTVKEATACSTALSQTTMFVKYEQYSIQHFASNV